MKSWTALNINEFILFDMFRSPCRRVEMFSKFAGSLNNYGVLTSSQAELEFPDIASKKELISI